jgi:hypothetical protein
LIIYNWRSPNNQQLVSANVKECFGLGQMLKPSIKLLFNPCSTSTWNVIILDERGRVYIHPMLLSFYSIL